MTAKIIPISRLPRQISILDYNIPAKFKNKIKKGQLVSVPFRSFDIFGLVFDIAENSNSKKLKDVNEIYFLQPILNDIQVENIKYWSDFYLVSAGTIAKMMLPPLQKLKIKKTRLKKYSIYKQHADIKKPNLVYYINENEHKKYLNKYATNNSLIIVPEIKDIDETTKLLEEKNNIITWHSQLSQKKQFENWFKIRNNKNLTIIGTRGSVFLPFQNLKNIIIDNEQDEMHKHWDQSPRFHSTDIVMRLSEQFGARVNLMSPSPSEESYFYFHKKNYCSDTSLKLKIFEKPVIIDMRNERFGKNYSPLSTFVQNSLESLENDSFIFINRKGYATSAGCNECGYVALCEKCSLPLSYHESNKMISCNYCGNSTSLQSLCPKCNAGMLTLRGSGIEKVEECVNKLTNNKTHKIIKIESEAKINLGNEKKIIIGTEAAFKFIDWSQIDLIVFLSTDSQMFLPEYMAFEHVWHLIRKTQYNKSEKSKFIIQTNYPEHLIFRSLAEPDRFYRTELNLRRSLLYPPYSYLIKYFYGSPDYESSKREAERMLAVLAEALTVEKKKVKITGPVEMQPKFYRQKYWHAILVKSENASHKDNLLWLNKFFSASWKVDPRPISLLSP